MSSSAIHLRTNSAVLAHGFWAMQGTERFINMNIFLEHFGFIGGLLMTALVA